MRGVGGRSCGLILVSLVVLAGAARQKSEYPDPRKDIRHIVPWGAGGATDTAMRGLMQYMEEHVGIPVVTENIPGGLSSVGLLHVKTARPDGYTIGTMTYDVLTLEYQGLAPVSWKDFEIVGMVTDHPSALVVAADRWPSLEAFVKAASTRPGAVKVGNVGTGGVWHQHAAAMGRALGVQLTHVPYEAGSGAQLAALLGGEVDANVTSLPVSIPYVRDGALRVLAVMAAERDELVPDAPTFRELGHDIVFGSFRIVVAPKVTPRPVVDYLERTLEETWRDPRFQSWARKAAIGARWRGSRETREYLTKLADEVRALMDELGLR